MFPTYRAGDDIKVYAKSTATFYLPALFLAGTILNAAAQNASGVPPVPDYQDAITLAAANADAPSGWVAPTGSVYTISGVPSTDAQYDIKYAGGNLIVRTETKSKNYKNNYVGQAGYSIYGAAATDATWVTTGSDATDFLRGNGVTGANATALLERGLGMNNTATHDAIVEYTVTPDNTHLMRPTKDPDITAYSANPSDYGTNALFPVSPPAGMNAEAYTNFQAYYNAWKIAAIDGATFPWTQLGYTFFWGNGSTQADIQGMSEFIIPGGTSVGIYGIYSTQSYIYTSNNGSILTSAAGSQYGNGFASFDIDGTCDTVWAGHRFQNNVRTDPLTPNEIIIENSGSVSGGSGLLIGSLNYDVTNNGSIIGATAAKYSIAGTANIAVLFQGDTSTNFGTPVLSGVNRLTNSGLISSPGTAVEAAAGETVVVNNPGGVISGGLWALRTGAGNDSVLIHGGEIDGGIDMGAGANSISIDGAASLSFPLSRDTASVARILNAGTVFIADNTATLAPVIGGLSNIRNNDSFLVIDAASLAADSAKIGVRNDPTHPGISFSPYLNGAQLFLVAARDPGYYSAAAGNPSLGTAIEKTANSATGDMAYVIGVLDSAGNPAAAAQLAPAADGGAYAAADQAQVRFESTVIDHLKGTSLPLKASSPAIKGASGPAVWGQGFDSYLHQEPRGNSNGYNTDIWGIAGGYDKEINKNTVIGAGAGYSRDSVRARKTGGLTGVDSYQGDIYGSCSGENYYASGVLLFAYDRYLSSRNISFGTIARTAKGDYGGWQYSAYFEGGRVYGESALKLSPLASLRYSHLRTNAYRESGADSLDLSVKAQNYDLLQPGTGFNVSYRRQRDGWSLTPAAHAKWLYALIADRQQAAAAFSGGGASFVTSGSSPARSSLEFGTDLKLVLRNNVTIFLAYDLELKAGFYSNSGSASFRYVF